MLLQSIISFVNVIVAINIYVTVTKQKKLLGIVLFLFGTFYAIMEFIVISLLAIVMIIVSNAPIKAINATIDDHHDGREIVFISVVFRHGDRAPDNNGYELYPTDPYKNCSFYPIGLGGLSARGKKREFELGRVLRQNYGDFLGETYLPGMVKARSTDYDRTKMSLMVVLSALYPPKGVQIWHRKINWQPIPISYFPVKDDILLLPDGCPLYLDELDKVRNSEEVQAKIDQFRPLMENLTHWTGKKIETPTDMYYLYHTLMAEQSWSLTLPEWTSGIFPYGELWNGTILEYQIDNYNTDLRRLFGGMLLKNITDTMHGIARDEIDGKGKLYLFSGHETNVASFLMTLGVYKPHVPEYTSAVIVELLRDRDNKYYVMLRHYLGIPPVLNVLQIPGCDINCPIDEFIKLLTDVMPQDADMICLR